MKKLQNENKQANKSSVQTTEIAVNTVIGNKESIKITEIAEQGSISEPTMNCATTAKINVGKKKLIINMAR